MYFLQNTLGLYIDTVETIWANILFVFTHSTKTAHKEAAD